MRFSVSATLQKLHAKLNKACAAAALRLYRARIRIDHWRLRHGLKIVVIVMLAAMLSTVFAMPFLQRVAGGYFSNETSLATLRALLGGTGAALVGAATIAFSLVVFAMQINVERMPHGLFSRLSSDRRLLGSFLGALLTALVIASMSLIPDGSWAIPVIVTAICGVAVIVSLFFYAYRRALQLINPIEQLSIMERVVRRDLHKWRRWAEKAAVILSEEPRLDTVNSAVGFQFDGPKAYFFQVNPRWAKVAGQAIPYAISYAKRFAEQGDYEVTEYAFECILVINASYCAAKHGTFVGGNPFVEIPGATDTFINGSLEQLRQTMQAALARGDERLAECTMRAIGGLYGVYLKIDYPGRDQSRHHALLAASYMGAAVESIISRNMPDLMMEGIRLMGRASRLALDHTDPTEIISAVQKIATLSDVGVLRIDHQPVTLTAFEQLSEIAYDLLIKGKGDIRFPIHCLRSAVTDAAKRFMETPESALNPMHRNTLGPYFSSTSISSLRYRLTFLVNDLLKAPQEDSSASEIIRNIEEWVDQMHAPQKELLLLAVQKRSSFFYDVISWAVGISELLNALSNAAACPQHLKVKLRDHALWLVSTLSWLPDDRESVTFVENYSLTETLFEAAVDGYERECPEFYEECKRLLIGWAKKGGGNETGWVIMEAAVKALVVLVINEANSAAVTALKNDFREMLISERAPQELRTRAAERLTRSVDEFRGFGGTHSRIDHALAQLDQSAVSSLIHEMAQILVADPVVQP